MKINGFLDILKRLIIGIAIAFFIIFIVSFTATLNPSSFLDVWNTEFAKDYNSSACRFGEIIVLIFSCFIVFIDKIQSI